MRAPHPQRGFTLIEIGVVVAAITVMAALVLPNLSGKMMDYHYEQTKEDLAGLQAVAHHYHDSITGSTQNGDGSYSYTYVTAVSSGSPINVADFNTQQSLNLVTTNPFGNPYKILITDANTYVSTVVPATTHDFYPGKYVDNGDGTGTVSFYNQRIFTSPRMPVAEVIKFSEYQEIRR